MWLPIGLIGCVFVCEVRQNDNGVQNISGLNNYLVKLFRTCLLATGLYPCAFCDEIYAVLATVVPRFVNPIPAEHLLNMRLNGLRILNVHAHHKGLFKLFQVPQQLMLCKNGVQMRRLIVTSFFVQNCYYCLQCTHSQFFGYATPTSNDYIPSDEVIRPLSPINLGGVWDFGNLDIHRD